MIEPREKILRKLFPLSEQEQHQGYENYLVSKPDSAGVEERDKYGLGLYGNRGDLAVSIPYYRVRGHWEKPLAWNMRSMQLYREA